MDHHRPPALFPVSWHPHINGFNELVKAPSPRSTTKKRNHILPFDPVLPPIVEPPAMWILHYPAKVCTKLELRSPVIPDELQPRCGLVSHAAAVSGKITHEKSLDISQES